MINHFGARAEVASLQTTWSNLHSRDLSGKAALVDGVFARKYLGGFQIAHHCGIHLSGAMTDLVDLGMSRHSLTIISLMFVTIGGLLQYYCNASLRLCGFVNPVRVALH